MKILFPLCESNVEPGEQFKQSSLLNDLASMDQVALEMFRVQWNVWICEGIKVNFVSYYRNNSSSIFAQFIFFKCSMKRLNSKNEFHLRRSREAQSFMERENG